MSTRTCYKESTVGIRFISLPLPPDVRPGNASVVVAVNGGSSGWKALDWATAEAAARRAPLHIVHVVAQPIMLVDPFGGAGPVSIEPRAPFQGALVLEEAVRRTHRVAPDVTVDTSLAAGNIAAAIRCASRDSALTVVGRGRPGRFGLPSSAWRIARRAVSPVVIVELRDQRRSGPSAGRVVLGIDGTPGSGPAVVYAFQAAERRGVGLTVIHACMPWVGTLDPGRGGGIEDLYLLDDIDGVLEICRSAYPDVDVHRRFVPGSAAAALVAESTAAALLVVGASPRRRRGLAPLGRVAASMFRMAHSPIAIVRASPISERVRRR
jgi:nucleotide-binding universal stress UspA family protein